MTCRLLGAKPFSEPMMTSLIVNGTTRNKLDCKNFHSRKLILKLHPLFGWQCCSDLDLLNTDFLFYWLIFPAWWYHQMEAFSALLALCAGNSPVTGEFPPQRPVTRSFDVFFDLRLNKRLSNQSWGRWLGRHRGYYDVIVTRWGTLRILWYLGLTRVQVQFDFWQAPGIDTD